MNDFSKQLKKDLKEGIESVEKGEGISFGSIEEDFVLAKVADERLRTEKEWFTHEEVWS